MFNDVERRKGNMKTNELEKEIGLSKYTIRYYEKEGLIQPKREILEGELDFRHCLKINQVNMQKQIESMN